MLRQLLTQTTNNNNTTSTTTMLTPPTNEAYHNVFINKDDLNLTNNLNNNNEKITLVHADNTPEFVIFIIIKKKLLCSNLSESFWISYKFFLKLILGQKYNYI